MNNNSVTFISHIVIAFVVICLLGLGAWQVARYYDKQQREHVIDTKSQIAPFSLNDIVNKVGKEDIRDFPIRLNGKLQLDRILLLDNRQIDGAIGFEVIVPAQTDYGTVLVNLGWIKGLRSRQSLPALPSLSSVLNDVTGVVVIPGINRFITETAVNDGRFPKVIQEVQFDRLADFTDKSLLPFMVTLTQSDPQFVRRWQPVVMASVKHIGYAIQWFGLAIAVVVIYRKVLRSKQHSENNNQLRSKSHE